MIENEPQLRKLINYQNIINDINETFVKIHIIDDSKISLIILKDFNEFKKLWKEC